jgi:sec-independent protein translocase protein TatC
MPLNAELRPSKSNDHLSWLDGFIKRRGGAEAEMSFLDHLEELRWHIIRSLAAVLLIAIFLFLNKTLLFDGILLAPKRDDFWTYRLMCRLGDWLHLSGFCMKGFSLTLTNIDLSAQFMIHLKTSFTIALVMVFPYVLWEFWRFLSPALYDTEKTAASGVVLAGSLLFYGGVLFGYYFIVPFTVIFLGTYQVSPEVQNQINLSSYIGTVSGLGFACGLVFEFPLVIYFLAKIGLATHEVLSQYRKVAVIVILILSAMITPSPDMFSQTLVAIPLYGLFEIGIVISRRVSRQKELKRAREEPKSEEIPA